MEDGWFKTRPLLVLPWRWGWAVSLFFHLNLDGRGLLPPMKSGGSDTVTSEAENIISFRLFAGTLRLGDLSFHV